MIIPIVRGEILVRTNHRRPPARSHEISTLNPVEVSRLRLSLERITPQQTGRSSEGTPPIRRSDAPPFEQQR